MRTRVQADSPPLLDPPDAFKEPSSVIAGGVLALALLITDCNSDTQRSAFTPELPFELLEIIIDYAVQDMIKTKIGKTVAALMHVSSLVRLRSAQAFQPARMYEAIPPYRNVYSGIQAFTPIRLIIFMHEALSWSIQDITVRQHGSQGAPNSSQAFEILV